MRAFVAFIALFVAVFAANAPVLPDNLQDRKCEAYAVHAEARGEPLRGQRAVLDIIRNRMWRRKLTACEVVRQPFQFSFYRPGLKMEATKQQLTQLRKLATMPSVLGTKPTYFHASYVQPDWSEEFKRVAVIGNHSFYTKE